MNSALRKTFRGEIIHSRLFMSDMGMMGQANRHMH